MDRQQDSDQTRAVCTEGAQSAVEQIERETTEGGAGEKGSWGGLQVSVGRRTDKAGHTEGRELQAEDTAQSKRQKRAEVQRTSGLGLELAWEEAEAERAHCQGL